MKLRVITRSSRDYPYQVQVKRRWWSPFWDDLDIFERKEDAIFRMKTYKLPPKPGTVIAEYTDKDRLIDKLKGN